MSRDKKAILECLESESLSRVITTDPDIAFLHVLPIGKLNADVSLLTCVGS